MSATMPPSAESSAYPLYLPTEGCVFNSLDLGLGAFSPSGMHWDSWIKAFYGDSNPLARLGMIGESLRRIRLQDKDMAFVWYLQAANGHDHGRTSEAHMSFTQIGKKAAFDEVCRAIAFAPFESRSNCRIRLEYVDSKDAIAAFMWFINPNACLCHNLPTDECWQRTALLEFIQGFARLHWTKINAEETCPYSKSPVRLSCWLVANRPCLLRYLYRYKMLESVRLPDDQLTPDDVAVLRDCVLGDPFNARPGAGHAKNLQEVRENGDLNAWEAVRLITRAEVRHRAANKPAESSGSSRRKKRRPRR